MASALAASSFDEEHHLIFIDQSEVKNNFYHNAVLSWNGSPFKTVNIFSGKSQGAGNKLLSRKKIFSELDVLIQNCCPDEIRVGNDRRIEFQYLMHAVKKIKSTVIGAYLDEGFFTYMGREASKSFSDRFVDGLLKKLAYGFWWKTPPTVGGSGWIDKAYVAFPDFVHKDLKCKDLIRIDKSIFQATEIKELSSIFLEKVGIDAMDLVEIDCLVMMPHESIYLKDEMYREKLVEIINKLSNKGSKLAIKYHPRDTINDGLSLSRLGVKQIENKVNFEALLFLLPACTVVGDMSSVLLTAKWLRDDLDVIAIGDGADLELKNFYRNLDISIQSVKNLSVDI